MKSNKGLYSAQTNIFSPVRYLSILLIGVITAGIMEIVGAITK